MDTGGLRLLWFVAPPAAVALLWCGISLWHRLFPVDDEEIDMPDR